MSREIPPWMDELEVSLFGAGVGEALCVHLGFGDWMVVDSCIEATSGQPVALEYLQLIGVDPSNAVKLVVNTHLHDDHARGVAAVLRQCAAATFACSAAATVMELLALIHASAQRETSITKEFAAVIGILEERRAPGQRAV